MRKKILMLLGLVLVLCLGCGKEKAPEAYTYSEASEGGFYTETANLQIYFEEGYMPEPEERDLAVYRLKTAREAADKFLGTHFAGDVVVCHLYTGEGVSQTTQNVLDIYYFDTIEQPYVNYMIQCLLGENVPDWLREGMAAYGAETVGESLLNSFAADVQALQEVKEQEETPNLHELAAILHKAGVCRQAEELEDMIQGIAMQNTAEEAGQYRAAYCIYAGSFTTSLAEQIGFDGLLRLYNGESFQSVTQKSLYTVHRDWVTEILENE